MEEERAAGEEKRRGCRRMTRGAAGQGERDPLALGGCPSGGDKMHLFSPRLHLRSAKI